MSIEVRRLRDDGEFEQYLNAAIYAFNSGRDGSQMERYQRLYEREWCLAAFDGGTLVAGLTLIPFEQHMLGKRIQLGGIATVASLPERRREGYVGKLLRGALREMRDAGQVLSGLYTPHYALYRRYGWEIANRMLSYSFAPKVMRTRLPRPAGSYRRVRVDEWEVLAGLRERFVSCRNGALIRTEGRWRAHVFSDYLRGEHDAVVWSNEVGEARGYAVYTQQHRQTGPPWGETVLRVIDWVALDGDAYSALLNYLMGHDLDSQIVITVSEDEPIPIVFEEPTHFREPQGAWLGMMLRIVDLPAAFEARPSPGEATGLSVTIGVNDDVAPWNAGAWRITSGEGRLSVEAATGPPQLAMDAVALGPMFNGFATPEAMVQTGLMRAHDVLATDALRKMLDVPFRPYCPDDF